jgi:hypothetical protein
MSNALRAVVGVDQGDALGAVGGEALIQKYSHLGT